ncbi:MAG: cell division protein FtsQ/DivIB [Desulfitobacteriia bacterium]
MPQVRPNTTFIYLIAMLCLIAVSLFMFSKSDFFTVDNVRLEGLNNITEDEVHKLLGSVKGENLFWTDTDTLAEKVELHPLVDRAVAEKELPATIVIKVQERRPVALILNTNGLVEIDSQGTVLKFYDTWPQEDNPVLTGIEVPDTIGPGQKLNSPQLDKALLFLGQAPDGLLPLLGEVNIAGNGQVFCYLNAGIEVRLGYGEDYSGKLKLLWELLGSSEFQTVQEAVKYIDLTAGKPVLGL